MNPNAFLRLIVPTATRHRLRPETGTGFTEEPCLGPKWDGLIVLCRCSRLYSRARNARYVTHAEGKVGLGPGCDGFQVGLRGNLGDRQGLQQEVWRDRSEPWEPIAGKVP